MEKQTSIPMDNTLERFKKFLKYGLGMAALIVLIIGVGQYGNAKEEYKPLSPQSEQGWQQKRQELCEQERQVAKDNLMDVAHGYEVNKDLNTLKAKRDMVCDFLPAA